MSHDTKPLNKFIHVACHIDCPHGEDIGEQHKVKKRSYQETKALQ